MNKSVLTGILKELEEEVIALDKSRMKLKTRADYLRAVRAAVEILPAVPKIYPENKAHGGDVVISRPRGVVYE